MSLCFIVHPLHNAEAMKPAGVGFSIGRKLVLLGEVLAQQANFLAIFHQLLTFAPPPPPPNT